MDYEDFTIQIVADGDGHAARVVSSPDGESSAPFVPPTCPFPLQAPSGEGSGRAGAGPVTTSRARGSGSGGRDLVPCPDGATGAPPPDLAAAGRRLFDALFASSIRQRFERSLAKVERSGGGGLRIKIKLDLADSRSAPLARLPWELLHSGPETGFLALSRRTPIVRYLDVPRAPYRSALPSPFRVLAVPSRPEGTAPLDLRREAEELSAACPRERIRIERLERASLRALRRKLLEAADRGAPFHGIHFMGHGGFEEDTGHGALLLEDEAGYPRPVTGRALARQLRDLQDLRLVVLNACHSGQSPRGPEAFTGVAGALVLGGLPAVLAMHCPIRDRDAIHLTSALYDRIAGGDPVDAALAEARLSLFDRDPAGAAWAIPMLFMRTPDGALFGPPAPRRKASAPARPGTWALDRLTGRAGRQVPPVLGAGREGVGRCVLAARVGPSLVVGRCLESQLRPAALERLRRSGEERVHWVVSWNEPRIAQVSARLCWIREHGSAALLVENLTDYSARPAVHALELGDLRAETVPPGERRRLPVPWAGGGDLVLRTGHGEEERKLVGLTTGAPEEVLPVLRTTGVAFPPSPESPESPVVRFLGLWIPLAMEDLVLRLERLGEPVEVPLAPDLPGATLRLSLHDGGSPVLSIKPRHLAGPPHPTETGRADPPVDSLQEERDDDDDVEHLHAP